MVFHILKQTIRSLQFANRWDLRAAYHLPCSNFLMRSAGHFQQSRSVSNTTLLMKNDKKYKKYNEQSLKPASVIDNDFEDDDELDETSHDVEHINNKGISVVPPNVQGNLTNEMKRLYDAFVEELTRHFSLKVDLRSYEDLSIKLENGEVSSARFAIFRVRFQIHKLSHLGRITMRNPQMIAINFTDNPSAIKPAKSALQNLAANINPEQDGILLYVQVPKVTREHRMQMIKKANSTIINNYRRGLNKVYSKYDQILTKTHKSADEAFRIRSGLLVLKRKFEASGKATLKEKSDALLKEVA